MDRSAAAQWLAWDVTPAPAEHHTDPDPVLDEAAASSPAPPSPAAEPPPTSRGGAARATRRAQRRLRAGGEAPAGAPAPTGPTSPHRAVPTAAAHLRLPHRSATSYAPLWWLGVHGGAGEGTLEQLLPGSRAADHAWPTAPGARMPTVLLARTSAQGLIRAQAAATQWAAGEVPDVDLLGLVLIADAPGQAPAPLRALSKLVAGGVPRVWHLPWIEALRLGAEPSALSLPRAARRALGDVASLLVTPADPSPTLRKVSHVAHAAARI